MSDSVMKFEEPAQTTIYFPGIYGTDVEFQRGPTQDSDSASGLVQTYVKWVDKFNFADRFLPRAPDKATSRGYQQFSNVHYMISHLQQRWAKQGRGLLLNNYIQIAYTECVLANLIGSTGVQLEVVIPDKDKASNKVLADWKDWARDCGLHGESLTDLLKLVASQYSTDGEGAIHIVDDDITLRALDMGYVPVTVVDDTKSSTVVLNGIRVNKKGVRLTYQYDDTLYDARNSVVPAGSTPNAKLPELPAADVFHFYSPLIPGQMRGLSPGRGAFDMIYDLTRFEQSALSAAIRAAQSHWKLGYDKDATPVDPREAGAEENINAKVIVKPGLINVPKGRTFEAVDTNYPSAVFTPFTMSYRNNIAAEFRVSTSTLFKDLSKHNFSSSRRGDIDERRMWMELRQQLTHRLLEPLLERWLAKYVKSESVRKAVVSNHKWVFPRWESLAPHQDMATDVKRLQQGIASHQLVMEEHGLDQDTIMDEEIKYMKDYLAKGKAAGIPDEVLYQRLGVKPPAPPTNNIVEP